MTHFDRFGKEMGKMGLSHDAQHWASPPTSRGGRLELFWIHIIRQHNKHKFTFGYTMKLLFMFSVVYCAQINLQRNVATARLMFNK